MTIQELCEQLESLYDEADRKCMRLADSGSDTEHAEMIGKAEAYSNALHLAKQVKP